MDGIRSYHWALALFWVTSLTACKFTHTETNNAPPPPSVTVSSGEQSQVIDWETATARIDAVDAVEIRPRVSGLLGRWPGIRSVALRVLDAMAIHGKAQSTLFLALLLSLLANLALIVVTALGLYAVNPGSFSIRLALVAPIGHLVNSLPLTPGGIGVGETAFNALFKLTGLSGGAEALLCVRLWNVLVGLLGLVVYLFGMQRSVYPYAEDLREPEVGCIAAESTS